MELRHLTLFLAAAEELNFTKAAARVFSTQSSLSRTIQELERELDVQLFDRSTAPLTLTPAGMGLRREAQGLIDHMGRVVDRVKSASKPTSTLVVGCLPDLPFQLLPDAIKRFRANLPETTVRLQMMSVGELDLAVADGLIDIGFSWGSTGAGERVGEFEVGLMMPRSHPLARLSSLHPGDVRLESLIVMGDDVGLPLHERLAASWPRGQTQPTVVQGVDRWEDGQRLVSAGLGAMLVPVHTAADLDQSGVLVRPFSPPLRAEVWLCWAPRGTEPRGADQRIEMFRSAVRAATRAAGALPAPSTPSTQPMRSAAPSTVPMVMDRAGSAM